MIPEVRHKLVAGILLAGQWYTVEGESYSQRGEMFVAKLSGLSGTSSGEVSDVTGRIGEIQAWRFKPTE